MEHYTDRELVEELFRRNEIIPESELSEGGYPQLTIAADLAAKVTGYCSFFTVFTFDLAGGLLTIGIWE